MKKIIFLVISFLCVNKPAQAMNQMTELDQQLVTEVCKGKCEEVKRLILAGAPINSTTAQKFITSWHSYLAPLHFAIIKQNAAMVQTLLEHNANPNIEALVTPDHHFHHTELDCPAEIWIRPLDKAALDGNERIVELLLDYGAYSGPNPRCSNCPNLSTIGPLYRCPYTFTPLMRAVCKNRINVVTLLLKRGINVNDSDRLNSTPLHMASMKGYYDLCVLLLQHKANIWARDAKGKTPENVANNPEIQELLKRWKAAPQEMRTFILAQHPRLGAASTAGILAKYTYLDIYEKLRVR